MHIQTIWEEDSKSLETARPFLAVGVIELWLGHLQPTLIPLHLLDSGSTGILSENVPFQKALCAIKCLGHLQLFQMAGGALTRRQSQLLKTHWPNIFLWLNFAWLNPQRQIPVANRTSPRTSVAFVWSGLQSLIPGFEELFMLTPGALHLGIKIWRFFLLKWHHSHCSTDDIEALVAYRSMVCLRVAIGHVDPAERLSTFLSASDMTVGTLADLFASQFNEDRREDSEIFKFLVILWEGDDGPGGGSLQRALQTRKFVSKLSGRLSALARPPNYLPPDQEARAVYVATAFRVLVDCMTAGNGVLWLRRGLRFRFIQTYVACADTLLYLHTLEKDRDAAETYSALTANAFIAQMMHPDVFALIDEAFCEIEKDARLLALHNRLLAANNSLGKDWSAVFQGRNNARRHIQAMKEPGEIFQCPSLDEQPCFYHLCNGPRMGVKTCSHCRGAFYCSRKCQTLDYTVHRHFCHFPIGLPSIYTSVNSQDISRTKYFIANAAFTEIRQNKSSPFLRMLREQYRSLQLKGPVPKAKIVIEIRVVPGPLFDILSYKDLRDSELAQRLYCGSLERLERHPQCLREDGLVLDGQEETVIHLDIRCIAFGDPDGK
ncbi:hypothetical protein DL96DRAFT_1581765, partial [Flagelloscypha sp. PMI_526]